VQQCKLGKHQTRNSKSRHFFHLAEVVGDAGHKSSVRKSLEESNVTASAQINLEDDISDYFYLFFYLFSDSFLLVFVIFI
jgi:hypothetical protein